jgi:glycosyltransferase involved in cell wall biosynthesis
MNNEISNAIQSYKVALNSQMDDLGGIIVCFPHAYSIHPKLKLAEIHLKTGQYDEAKFWIDSLKETGHPAYDQFLAEYYRVMELSTIRKNLPKSDDLIITCPPNAMGDWDEHTLVAKGHGGSETAAVEVARWIKQKTKRNVKIFQTRVKRDEMPSGVEYIPVTELNGYIKNIEPYAHIAWRHATRLTYAKSYVWCHDLQIPGGNMPDNYDKVIALSEFHKNYLNEVSHVPLEKIVLGFNGVNPEDFPQGPVVKDKFKIVFSSSPDRGLTQAIDIVKRAREKSGYDLKLHCFYGTDNMRKMGQAAWAEQIENKIKENSDFVVYHGMVPKRALMQHFSSSAVWLYLNDFLETFCITAIEAMCAGTWPIVRPIAALPFTMKDAIEKDCCTLIKQEGKTKEDQEIWANALIEAVKNESWRIMDFPLEKYSWEHVADFFIREMNL